MFIQLHRGDFIASKLAPTGFASAANPVGAGLPAMAAFQPHISVSQKQKCQALCLAFL
jgi:hypothetical protein